MKNGQSRDIVNNWAHKTQNKDKPNILDIAKHFQMNSDNVSKKSTRLIHLY